MRSRSTFRLAVAEIVAIGVNIVPVSMWFFNDLAAEATMLVYAAEAVASILFAIVCVMLVSPSYDAAGPAKYKRRSKLIADFSIVAFGFLSVLVAFVLLFVFLVLKSDLDLRAISIALAIVLAFQIAELVVGLITLRPLPLKRAQTLLSRSMGRTAVLFFGVFLGVFLAAFVNEWFVLPLVVLKTIIDVGEPIQFFLGKGEDVEVLASHGRSSR